MKYRAYPGLVLSLLAFAGLLAFPAQAAEGARRGLELCGQVIVPSLFPFAALSRLLLELRLPHRLGKFMEPVTRRLLGVSGAGGAAFILGLTGGYPLGALTVSDMYASGQLDRAQAETLLGFCDNSGPAFVVSAVGVSVFRSPKLGFCLYGIHALSALLTGILLRGDTPVKAPMPEPTAPFGAALTKSVSAAAVSAVTLCGFVVFFSVLTSLLDSSGLLPLVCLELSSRLGLELSFTRALASGLLELGSGAGALAGLEASVKNLSLASFLMAWGGLSVQAQAASALSGSGLPMRRHFIGKLLHALLAAALTPVFLNPLLCPFLQA